MTIRTTKATLDALLARQKLVAQQLTDAADRARACAARMPDSAAQRAAEEFFFQAGMVGAVATMAAARVESLALLAGPAALSVAYLAPPPHHPRPASSSRGRPALLLSDVERAIDWNLWVVRRWSRPGNPRALTENIAYLGKRLSLLSSRAVRSFAALRAIMV